MLFILVIHHRAFLYIGGYERLSCNNTLVCDCTEQQGHNNKAGRVENDVGLQPMSAV